METAFTRLVGCRLPVQSAAMPGVATPELVGAVAGAGGLGMLPAPMVPAQTLAAQLDALAGAAGGAAGAVGANFLMPFLELEAVEAAASRARVVECFYGVPDPELVARIHAGGALASWQVGSPEEAHAALDAGCDLLVAQGVEAGGHVRGGTALLPLLGAVLEVAGATPVLAAGGLATGADLAAVLAAGAAGARVGTRLLASAESGAHPVHVEAVLRARAPDTVLTEAFSGMWPDAPHRVLRTCVDAASALPDGPVGELAVGDGRMPVPRFAVPSPTRGSTGHVEAMALYAGHSVERIRDVRPAAEIVTAMVDEAGERLRTAAGAAGA